MTIRQTAIDLLTHVDHHEAGYKGPRVPAETPGARSVGLPYSEIMDRVRNLHPTSKTTVPDLRWYACQVRSEAPGYEGLRLPQRRPRSRLR